MIKIQQNTRIVNNLIEKNETKRKESFSTARKSGNISSHTEKLFSSDTCQSMKRRIATERLSKIYIARCGYTWLDESKWPQEWPISPIIIVYLKIPSEKMKSFCLHKTGF